VLALQQGMMDLELECVEKGEDGQLREKEHSKTEKNGLL
jgi:hypothetical protein